MDEIIKAYFNSNDLSNIKLWSGVLTLIGLALKSIKAVYEFIENKYINSLEIKKKIRENILEDLKFKKELKKMQNEENI